MQTKGYQLTAHYIQSKYKLPKLIAKKIEEVNHLVYYPNEIMKKMNRKSQSNKQYRDQINQNEKQKKKFANIEQKDIDFMQNLIILKKLKKYKPANGSFSQHYGQKLSLNENNKSQYHTSILRQLQPKTAKYYPPLRDNPKKKSHKIDDDKNYVLTDEGSLRMHNSQPKYLSKLNEIKKTSDLLRKTSMSLAKKAQSVVVFNEHRFEKLQHESKRMLSGEEYIIDEELSKDYQKNQIHEPIRWKSKKKIVAY